jgi:hypothetical protein
MDALVQAIALEDSEGQQDPKLVSLRQRSQPMLKMLKTCQEKSADVVWGV